eukprot:COSAG01_NODE_1673_length_9542_cov_12.825765_2_plen_52_part_00
MTLSTHLFFTQQLVAITPTALRVRFKYISANQRQHVRLALTAYIDRHKLLS